MDVHPRDADGGVQPVPVPPAAARNQMKERLDAVKQLLELFKLERMVYVTVTMLALLILLTSAIVLLLIDRKGSAALATGLFGASGIVTATTGRLLRMWNQAFAAIMGAVGEDKNADA